MSDLPDRALPATHEPLRLAIRRLRWFRDAFARQLAEFTARTGVDFTVDDRRLAQVFVAWLRDIEAQKPVDPSQRRAYFDFASSLMLRNLLRDEPLKAGPVPPGADLTRAEYFWPEGLACTLFCLNVRAAILEQEFDAETTVGPDVFSLRDWWSFRENVANDPNTAMGFFDLLTGNVPEWQMPDSFHQRWRRLMEAPAPPTSLAG